MNYLAHCYLSFSDEALLVGNYLGDFVKNRHVDNYPKAIKEGIFLHRKIDRWTDSHSGFRKGTALLHSSMGKYAPVVLDIYFDYLLTKNWGKFSKQTFQLFCQKSYHTLQAYAFLMPDNISDRLQRMISGRWLEKYQSYEGLDVTYGYLARRAKFPNQIQDATSHLQKLEPELEMVFLDFFPQLVAFAKEEMGTTR
ncbi:MAG: ACP phosphodiesterase [Saprospiraceae bacterium]|nr:ACP phosphodiesterase [Saprospiraceae bacterium]